MSSESTRHPDTAPVERHEEVERARRHLAAYLLDLSGGTPDRIPDPLPEPPTCLAPSWG